MIDFEDLRIVPEVQHEIERGVAKIRVIITVSEKYAHGDLLSRVRSLAGLDVESLSASEHYVFATLTPRQIQQLAESDEVGKIWLNKKTNTFLAASTGTIGASSAWVDYDSTGEGITWAVIDNGIDSSHVWFKDGTVVDHINVTSEDGYGGHATHVAAIIAGHWPDEGLSGVAPRCKLVDVKAVSEKNGDAGLVIRALEKIRQMNEHAGELIIHGVNLSVGFPNERNVKEFQCGHSPVCEETDRLVESGVIVCVAAGNSGGQIFWVPGEAKLPTIASLDMYAAFVNMTIADPANADLAIAVGSTHKEFPERYGISSFSSKGPTGDGRLKPDLVAPGEKIVSAIPGNKVLAKSGTSQAAPHVSGAVALLLSSFPNLIGKPSEVKDILLKSCRDLGRFRHSQGAGFLDVAKALDEASQRKQGKQSLLEVR